MAVKTEELVNFVRNQLRQRRAELHQSISLAQSDLKKLGEAMAGSGDFTISSVGSKHYAVMPNGVTVDVTDVVVSQDQSRADDSADADDIVEVELGDLPDGDIPDISEPF